jgi:hypothetical protein
MFEIKDPNFTELRMLLENTKFGITIYTGEEGLSCITFVNFDGNKKTGAFEINPPLISSKSISSRFEESKKKSYNSFSHLGRHSQFS